MKKTTSVIRVGTLLTIGLGVMTWGRTVSAEISLAGVFADRMVVQRDRPLTVWGTASPGETVTVEFAGKSASAAADGQWHWRITLEPSVADAV